MGEPLDGLQQEGEGRRSRLTYKRFTGTTQGKQTARGTRGHVR